MNANTQLQKNLQIQPLKGKTKVIVEEMNDRKTSKLKGPQLRKTSVRTEPDSKLGIPRCGRGITKRAALGNIGNKGTVIQPKEGEKKIDSKIRIRQKIEASKVLIGLKSKKIQKTTSKSTIIKQEEVTKVNEDGKKASDIAAVTRNAYKEMPFSLPEGVDNIDAECSEDPQMCTENAQKIIAYIRHLESIQNIKPNFLSGSRISGKMRAVLVNWLAEVHLQFKLIQETLYLTVGILDRYLAIESNSIKRPKIQLVGVCAMLIACKYEEMYIPQVDDFIYITDEAYTAQEILQMEQSMLQALNFQLGRPIAITFLRRNSKAGNVDLLHHWLAKYILESCLVEYELAHVQPSEMAAAALLLSLKLHDPKSQLDTLWSANLIYYSGYKFEKLTATVQKIAMVMKDIHTSKFNAAYVKYNSTSNQKIASVLTSNSEVIDVLNNFAADFDNFAFKCKTAN